MQNLNGIPQQHQQSIPPVALTHPNFGKAAFAIEQDPGELLFFALLLYHLLFRSKHCPNEVEQQILLILHLLLSILLIFLMGESCWIFGSLKPGREYLYDLLFQYTPVLPDE